MKTTRGRKPFASSLFKSARSRVAVPLRRRVLACEALEDRCVPATFSPTLFVDGTGVGTLRRAVIDANATPSPSNVINLQAGVYALAVGGASENASFTGDLDVTGGPGRALTIQGAGAGVTVLDAAALGDRVLHVVAPGTTLVLRDLTIQGGQATDGAGGGGILNEGGVVTLERVVVTRNAALGPAGSPGIPGGPGSPGGAAEGGGIRSVAGVLNVSGSIIANNDAIGGDGGPSNMKIGPNPINGAPGGPARGGGIAVSGGVLTITDSQVTGNRASGGEGRLGSFSFPGAGADSGAGGAGGAAQGAGIFAFASTVTLARSIVLDNANIGGIGGVGGSSSGLFLLVGAGGAGGAAQGAGLFVSGGSVGVTASTLAGNSNTGHAGGAGGTGSQGSTGGAGGAALGGGAFVSGSATVVFTNSTVSSNLSTGGAGGPGSPRTLPPGSAGRTGRNGPAQGGGIFVEGPGNSLTLRNSTVAANQSAAPNAGGVGGGVFNGGGTVTAISTLFGDNAAATAPDFNGVVTASASLFESAAGATILAGPFGPNILGQDAGLGPLTANGGPTPTQAIAPGSPAFNTGANPFLLRLDQRGPPFARNSGGAPDIGAFEAQVGNNIGAEGVIAVGTDGGALQPVRVFASSSGAQLAAFFPFGAGFQGGVRVAVGDVNGDGVPDVIAGAGPGAAPHVKVFDGRTFQEIASFLAYDAGFHGGVFVAAGDVNGDGHADMLTGADAGPAGGHVKVFDGVTHAEIRSFFAYPGFAGGVRVAAGDVNGDGKADLITGAGPGAGSHVKVFDGFSGAELASFFAFGSFQGGVYVAAGDFNGDGRADVITGAGPGAGPHVKVFNGPGGSELASFFAYGNFAGGVRVGTADIDGDGLADILTGVGPGLLRFAASQAGTSPPVKVFQGPLAQEVPSPFALDALFAGGLFVAGF
jgi:trimeric autotransporter adhesin